MLDSFKQFIKLIIKQRFLIVDLAKREIAGQYVGSLLGVLWTFIQPLVLIIVFWFVFSLGFKVKPTNDVPFVIWLTAGLAPWFLFAHIITSSTGAVIQHANLVKKTIFHSEILPIVNILSATVTHIVFLLLLTLLMFFYKLHFTLYLLQFFYYLFCLVMLSLGLGWIFSALNVFLRDVGQIVGLVLQVGFWATPIFWDIKMMSPQVQTFLKLNPMFYIVEGYRNSFIYQQGVWHTPYWTLYFWSITLFLLVIGITVFQRLKPQFADVL